MASPYVHESGFTLFVRTVYVRGRAMPHYYFGKRQLPNSEPAPVPDGFTVRTSPTTGLPYLQREGWR